MSSLLPTSSSQSAPVRVNASRLPKVIFKKIDLEAKEPITTAPKKPAWGAPPKASQPTEVPQELPTQSLSESVKATETLHSSSRVELSKHPKDQSSLPLRPITTEFTLGCAIGLTQCTYTDDTYITADTNPFNRLKILDNDSLGIIYSYLEAYEQIWFENILLHHLDTPPEPEPEEIPEFPDDKGVEEWLDDDDLSDYEPEPRFCGLDYRSSFEYYEDLIELENYRDGLE